MRILSRLMCLMLLVVAPAQAMEFSYAKQPPYAGSPIKEVILARGEIVPGDYQRLVDFIRKDPKRFQRQTHITVASPGGDIVEALQIADLIHYTYLSLRVREDAGPCVSACFFIWVSAVDRMGPARLIGIHRPYIDPAHVRNLAPSEAQELQGLILKEVRQFLVDSVTPSRLIDMLFQRASTEVYWLSTDDLLSIGLQAPWYEEYLIANCSYEKGAGAKLLRTTSGSAEQKVLLQHMREVLSCGRAKTESERTAYVAQVLNPPPEGGETSEHDPAYVRKVRGVRELIREKQVRTEVVSATTVTSRDLTSASWSFPAADVGKLEAAQTWWLDLDEGTNWASFTVYVRNATSTPLSAVAFQLSNTTCKGGIGRGPIFALKVSRPLQPFEDRAIKFSAELPDGHPLLTSDGPVCGTIVGALPPQT